MSPLSQPDGLLPANTLTAKTMTWKLYPIEEFRSHAAEWDALQRSCSHTAFLESLFLLPLLTEFGDGQERLALKREDGQLRAGAILRRVGVGRWETFQPSQLPLGTWVSTSAQPVGTQVRELLIKLPGLALILGITQLDSMLHPRPTDSPTLRAQDYIETAWIDIAGGFDAYWETLGKNLRQNTKKQRNKLATEGTEVKLECVTKPEHVEQAMRDYGALEGAGWKAADGTAILPDNVQGRFYRRMLESFCDLGRGRIYRYRFGDKVVSMDLCIDSGPVIVILKTAYDESYKSVSPSTLMRQEQFRHLFEEGRYSRIEFYGKVMEWHTRWTTNSRPVYHATNYRWPTLRFVHERLAQRALALK